MSAEREYVLTSNQKRLVGFALGFAALLLIVALSAATILVLGRAFGLFSGVIWPLVVAGVTAMILRPVVDIIQVRLKVKRIPAVLILFGVFGLVVTGLALLITPRLVEQILDFIAFVPTFWQRALAYVQQNYPDWVQLFEKQMHNDTVRGMVESLLEQAKGLMSRAIPTLKAAGGGVMNIVGFFTHAAVIPIYLFFFLLSRTDPTKNLGENLPFLKEGLRKDIVFLVGEFLAIIVSFFRGQLVIGLIMGAMLAAGFSLVGLKFGLFIGLTLGILNIVPYLGTIIGLSIALPLAFLQPEGGWSLVGLVLIVFVIVQNIEGWFLTPKIMGDRTGLHPVTIIVAIFFWGTALNGILGMVLAIPLTAFFVTAWRLGKKKYLVVPD